MSTPPTRREQRGRRRPTRRTTALLAAAVVLILGGVVAGGAWWVQRDDAETAVAPGTYVPPSEISDSSPGTSSTTSPSSSSDGSSSDGSSSTSQGSSTSSTTSDDTSSTTSHTSSSTSESTSSTSSSTSSTTSSSSSSADTGGSTLNPEGSPTNVVVESGGEEVIDASLQATHLDSENVLAPPFGTAGWYAEPGWPKPGYQGASILVGHINHGSNPDVFWNLPEVNIGDIVTVRYDSGEQVKFRITRSEAASKEGVPDDDSIWDYDNPDPVLRMITCDPQTTFEDGHYEGNWVVWAEPL